MCMFEKNTFELEDLNKSKSFETVEILTDKNEILQIVEILSTKIKKSKLGELEI